MDDTAVTVAAVRDVGPDAIALDIETPPEFDAAPGQFVKLILDVDGEDESRFYTISSPNVADTFELTIGIDPDGDVSPELRELAAGDEVGLSGPYGNAFYEGETSVCLLAGGPGIGPAVGIAERTLNDGGNAAIIYRDDTPIHEQRLGALADRDAFVSIVDSEGSLMEAVENALGTALEANEELSEEIQVFIYGFADFLDDAMGAIEAAGWESDRAKVENFG
jgi:3-phenylpropionate/trans-cinnamate dioxygenase ferredoxin reductase subunit